MIILGLNAYHGDAAAVLIRDGRIVAAAEEERFNRIKHCAGFPTESVRYLSRSRRRSQYLKPFSGGPYTQAVPWELLTCSTSG